MENSLFAVIIKVKNLDICRSFYRDILDLGEPVLDSNFWVEFKLPCSFTLVLEKVDRKGSTDGDNMVWGCQIENIDLIKSRLDEYGYHIRLEKAHRIGVDFYICHDPEGNAFYMLSRQYEDFRIQSESGDWMPDEIGSKKEWKTIRLFKTPGKVE